MRKICFYNQIKKSFQIEEIIAFLKNFFEEIEIQSFLRITIYWKVLEIQVVISWWPRSEQEKDHIIGFGN